MMSMSLPQPSDGFEWAQAPWGPVRPVPALARRRGALLHRRVARAARQDEREWEAVAAFAGVPRPRLRLLNQVHGTAIAVVACR